MAPANRPTLATGWEATAVSDIAAIAPQISATRRPGTRGRAPLLSVRGRARNATIARMQARPATLKKAPRQLP